MSAPLADQRYAAPARLASVQSAALFVAMVAGIASVIGLFVAHEQFFRSYLLAFMFWLGISLGSLAFLMVQHLAGGMWGFTARRILEASARNVVLMALLFLPLIFGAKSLYEWAHPGAQIAPHLHHKAAYLSVGWWAFRGIAYFVLWILLALVLNYWSQRQDDQPYDYSWRYQKLSGAGMVIYIFTMTFAAVDWVMSLDPLWYSTIYGLLYVGGQAISGISLVIVIGYVLSRWEPMASVYKAKHYHDWGNFLLMAILLWAYFSFSQLLIIWSGNLPEEITWYIDRLNGGWQWVGLALAIAHFAVPFALLLSKERKRHIERLVVVAVWMLVMRVVGLWWLTRASMDVGKGHLHLSWLDPVVFLAMGGLWVAAFLWRLRSRPLLPLLDVKLEYLLTEKSHGH